MSQAGTTINEGGSTRGNVARARLASFIQRQGALIMQVITTSFNMRGIPFSWGLVLKAAIILIAVYIQRPKVS